MYPVEFSDEESSNLEEEVINISSQIVGIPSFLASRGSISHYNTETLSIRATLTRHVPSNQPSIGPW
jgi:hypothetical protein